MDSKSFQGTSTTIGCYILGFRMWVDDLSGAFRFTVNQELHRMVEMVVDAAIGFAAAAT